MQKMRINAYSKKYCAGHSKVFLRPNVALYFPRLELTVRFTAGVENLRPASQMRSAWYKCRHNYVKLDNIA